MAKSETKKNNLNILYFLLESFIETYKGIFAFKCILEQLSIAKWMLHW